MHVFSLNSIFYSTLLSYLAQPTLLNNTEYVAFIEAVNRDCGDPIFGASTGNNMVSEHELHAHNHALRNYINCVNTI